MEWTYEQSKSSYSRDDLGYYVATARRHDAKDRFFLARLKPYFRPGTVLELGSACGQLSAIVKAMGFSPTASDVQPFFVDYMKSQGLDAAVVDATDIQATVPDAFDNVLAQAVSTLVTRDLDVVRRCYASIHAALKPGGRLLFIFPNALRRPRWSVIEDHEPIIRSVGFKTIAVFRDQVLPSAWYGKLGRAVSDAVERTLGRVLGLRWVLVLEK